MSRMMHMYALESTRVAAIMLGGDLLAQTWIEKRPFDKVDWVRCAKFSLLGFFWVSPCLKTWYTKLDTIVSRKQQPLVRGLKKVALDQILFAPPFTISIMAILDAMNGESFGHIEKHIKKDFPTIILNNWCLWTPAQIINFSLVPIAYQVLFAQFVALFWNCYLSMKLNQSK